jgi:hypothetical protein
MERLNGLKFLVGCIVDFNLVWHDADQ